MMNPKHGWAVVLTTFLSLGVRADVLISEVMHHPASTNLLETWCELHNPASTNVDLSGWRLANGFQLTLPTNTVLAGSGFLVVPADLATFRAQHPAVVNVLPASAGPIEGHTLELQDTRGATVNTVQFHDEGDWAIRRLGPLHYEHRGWEWAAAHAGGGSSLELVNVALPNTFAHNWASSSVAGGTPGQANSVLSSNVAPLIAGVRHHPIIPQPTDDVRISARVLDEQATGLTVILHHRVDGEPAFAEEPMTDDGAHGDGLAGDGVFAAILPPRPHATVVEFYVEARDAQENSRLYPAFEPPAGSPRTANLLYQVDSGSYGGAQPIYRIIMTEIERAELYALGRKCPDSDSDAAMNATLISLDGVVTDGTSTQVRYSVGVRNRGHGSRQANPNNYHLDIPTDRLWKDRSGINLNSQYAHSHVIGSAIFRRLGLPMPDSRAVQVRVNSTNLMAPGGLPSNNSHGSYAANDQYNTGFIQRQFPGDDQGQAYRGMRNQAICNPIFSDAVADLKWHGPDHAIAAYTNAYFKESQKIRNDWADLITLIGVLNVTNGTTASSYVTDVERVLDVDAWMKYMAANTLLDSTETSLASGYGDDYGLYRGTNDTRFVVLPYDLDSVLGRGQTPTSPHRSIFRMHALPVIERLMKTPEFAPRYYQWLLTFAQTTFSSAQMDPLLDQVLNDYVPRATIDNLKSFNASQVAWVLSQIPQTLTVSNSLTVQNGFPRATSPTVALAGTAHAAETRSVRVQSTPATWVAWQGTWAAPVVPLRPGLNRLLVQAFDVAGKETERAYTDVWYDAGSPTTVSGALPANTTWTASGGPYLVASTLTVAAGITLSIEAGTTVYLGDGADLVVAQGARLLAEGTAAAPIRFTVAPGSGVSWGGLVINGTVGSPETRIAYAHFDGNGTTCIESVGGTLVLDHASFGTTTHQYVSVDNSSFVLSDCVFPSGTTSFELLHGSGGIKAGGRGIVQRCFFGSTIGYSDVFDFTGGNRDLNQPIIQFLNNVFVGSSDDHLDLDGTDAWIEGNIFLHVHRNGSPDSASAISGGNDGTRTSEITAIGNLFFDCDQAATAKQGNFVTLLNNTIVRTTRQGGQDSAAGVVNVQDISDSGTATTFGRGFYLEGNVIVDAEQLVRNYDPAQTTVTFQNNILPFAWAGPGAGNLVADPLLRHIPDLTETQFQNWEEAQVLRGWFRLGPGSPAWGTGPHGRDQGGLVPLGASIAGEPSGTTASTSATLTVGSNRRGAGIPTAGWPDGSGYTHYRWRLDGGAWSAETPIASPIALTGLGPGSHQVEVAGRRDSGWYQDDPVFGSDAGVTASRVWTVDPAYVAPTRLTVRLNEVLAQNATTLTNAGTTPDLVELHNFGSASVDLVGLGLTDNAEVPHKYAFPAGTPPLGPGEYLVLLADNDASAPGLHLGFTLRAGGDDLSLFDQSARGGALLDAVTFGPQLADHSISRMPDGTWVLSRPTMGSRNASLALGDPARLRINEWLADAQFAARNDFLELFNTDALPVALGGLLLSDAAGSPARHPLAPLSFVAGGGFLAFIADGQPNQGPDHLGFRLSADAGLILLHAPDLTLLDAVNYGPQRTDVSQGRSPSGSDTVTSFAQPTSGGPNPGLIGLVTVTNITRTIVPLLNVATSVWRWNAAGLDLGSAWRTPSFDDTSWNVGTGLFGRETTPQDYPYPFVTPVPAPSQGGPITAYYRAHFNWPTELSGYQLIATNYVDDGAVYYLNGVEAGRLRITADPVLASTRASDQGNEGAPEVLAYTNAPVAGDNVLAVEVHQVNSSSGDHAFGLSLIAVQFATNFVTQTFGVPVVLNEVLARNPSFTNFNDRAVDSIELFNPDTNAVDLSGLSLSNDANDPQRWVFPPGSTIAPLAHRIVFCDDTAPPSASNTGFGLRGQGDKVYFFHRPAAGGSLIDAIRFGLQVPGFAIGRVPNGEGNWTLTVPTPEAPNTAAGQGSMTALRLNEWMADRTDGPDWFEIVNTADQPVALDGLFFTDNLTDPTQSPVEPLSFIGGGGLVQFIADGDAQAGADHVGFNLKKSGEALALFSPTGVMLDGVSFGGQVTDVSQGRLPDGGPAFVSFSTTATAGGPNYLPLPDAVINEVLTHTDPPFEDAVELFNPSDHPVPVGGWFLSNTRDNLKKFRLADGAVIPAHGFLVIYENAFNTGPDAFTFNSARGDAAILAQADALGNLTGFRAEVQFGAAQNGVSSGRFQTSVGVDFVPLNGRTFGQDNPASLAEFRTGAGAPNAPAKVGPLVISEIHYFPQEAGLENAEDEFIEVENVSGVAVPLFDPAYPTNTWRLRDAVSFTFPTQFTLAAGARLLVVGFPPADAGLLSAFRTKYQVPAEVPVLGPWNGRLANDCDSVELIRPDAVQMAPHPDAGLVPEILVDRVRYSAIAPWPTVAGGGNISLQRLALGAYGNDPLNWVAVSPTAGRPTGFAVEDADQDGLPDAWEMAHFGSLDRDGSGDFDRDGLTDREELQAGTDPQDPSSAFQLMVAGAEGGAFTLRFLAAAGRSYTVQYRDSWGTGDWVRLVDLPPQEGGLLDVTDVAASASTVRYYRVVTPRLP